MRIYLIVHDTLLSVIHSIKYNMSINNRAQVPGYCGFIPGKASENKFGGTFAKVTSGSYPTPP